MFHHSSLTFFAHLRVRLAGSGLRVVGGTRENAIPHYFTRCKIV